MHMLRKSSSRVERVDTTSRRVWTSTLPQLLILSRIILLAQPILEVFQGEDHKEYYKECIKTLSWPKAFNFLEPTTKQWVTILIKAQALILTITVAMMMRHQIILFQLMILIKEICSQMV